MFSLVPLCALAVHVGSRIDLFPDGMLILLRRRELLLMLLSRLLNHIKHRAIFIGVIMRIVRIIIWPKTATLLIFIILLQLVFLKTLFLYQYLVVT